MKVVIKHGNITRSSDVAVAGLVSPACPHLDVPIRKVVSCMKNGVSSMSMSISMFMSMSMSIWPGKVM